MMDTKTGSIGYFESALAAREAGHDLQLTEEQAADLLPLPPQQRLAVAKQWTTEARRERKAKRKAQRAARKAQRR